MTSTHYDTLQVTETASPEVIRGAYRYLSHKWHPDKNPEHREQAERESKGINAAYEILSDPDKRAIYDQTLRAKREGREQVTQTSYQPDPASYETNEKHFDAPRVRTFGGLLDFLFGFIFIGIVINILAIVPLSLFVQPSWLSYVLLSLVGGAVWLRFKS
jgi:DnaJ-class molecular chaperone